MLVLVVWGYVGSLVGWTPMYFVTSASAVVVSVLLNKKKKT